MSKESSSFGKSLSRFIIVIASVGIGLRLLVKGIIDAEKLAIFLVIVVIAAAIERVWFKIILAFSGIAFFLIDITNYDLSKFQSAAASVGVLIIVLFGIFVMVGGMRKRK